MKKIIAIVVILLLLVAGGLGGSALLGYGPLAPLFHPAVKKEEVPAEPPAPEPPKHKVLEFGSYNIPIIENHEIKKQISIDLQLDVNPEGVELATLSMPRLQSAVRITLYDFLPHHANPQNKSDRQAIHDVLVQLTTDMLGAGVVRDVLIKAMHDR